MKVYIFSWPDPKEDAGSVTYYIFSTSLAKARTYLSKHARVRRVKPLVYEVREGLVL